MAITKEECLSRYRARLEKRRELAQQVIDGKRKIGDHWPTWQQYDVIAEIKEIKEERAEASKKAKRKKHTQENEE